jgi:hypothetical protein
MGNFKGPSRRIKAKGAVRGDSWTGVVVLELLLSWNRVRCHPPLIDDEVAAVVESIGRLHARQEQLLAPHI